MEIQKFKEQMLALIQIAQAQDKQLKKEQIAQAFAGLELQEAQMLELLRYLRLQGVQIEGAEPEDAASGAVQAQTQDAEETGSQAAQAKLSPQEREYLREYRASLEGQAMEAYLQRAVDIALQIHNGELLLADLIQEANVSLFLALEQRQDESDEWLYEEIRRGLKRVVAQQRQQDFEDDYLVEKVKKLDEAVKELSEDEDGKESAFSVNELAIILDMEPEEMRDILRLTGDEA
ncbi:MAG: hypothetical protein Q4B57_05235 [Eubacteriales bacterium]|nr:hypothetical protein [Eubacteriales bacterium]